MSVYYKFKSALSFDTLQFDDIHISLADFKKAVIQQKQLGKGANFDLQVTNAETNETYVEDTALIPKNSSLIVARVPLPGQKKTDPTEGLVGIVGTNFNTENIQTDVGRKLVQSVDLSTADASEEDKIKAMMFQSTVDYDPANYVKLKGGNQYGEPPVSYVCYKCHQKGHWIKDCPLNTGEIKKSSGIPLCFMIPVDNPSVPGALMTPTGTFAVPIIDQEAYKQGKKEKPFNPNEEPQPVFKPDIPDDLVCSLCQDLLTDVVMMPCCGQSFCDECIRNALLESEDNQCPDCKEKDISPESLIPNRFLRNKVNAFVNKTGYKGNQKATATSVVSTPVCVGSESINIAPVNELPSSSITGIFTSAETNTRAPIIDSAEEPKIEVGSAISVVGSTSKIQPVISSRTKQQTHVHKTESLHQPCTSSGDGETERQFSSPLLSEVIPGPLPPSHGTVATGANYMAPIPADMSVPPPAVASSSFGQVAPPLIAGHIHVYRTQPPTMMPTYAAPHMTQMLPTPHMPQSVPMYSNRQPIIYAAPAGRGVRGMFRRGMPPGIRGQFVTEFENKENYDSLLNAFERRLKEREKEDRMRRAMRRSRSPSGSRRRGPPHRNRSRSRSKISSRSPSKSSHRRKKSRTRSPSEKPQRSKSKSRSTSRQSRTRSRSPLRAKNSRSVTPSEVKPNRAESSSPVKSSKDRRHEIRSKSRSGSATPSRSVSRSRRKRGTVSRSKSWSKSYSRSPSRARSYSRSPSARTGYRSPRRSPRSKYSRSGAYSSRYHDYRDESPHRRHHESHRSRRPRGAYRYPRGGKYHSGYNYHDSYHSSRYGTERRYDSRSRNYHREESSGSRTTYYQQQPPPEQYTNMEEQFDIHGSSGGTFEESYGEYDGMQEEGYINSQNLREIAVVREEKEPEEKLTDDDRERERERSRSYRHRSKDTHRKRSSVSPSAKRRRKSKSRERDEKPEVKREESDEEKREKKLSPVKEKEFTEVDKKEEKESKEKKEKVKRKKKKETEEKKKKKRKVEKVEEQKVQKEETEPVEVIEEVKVNIEEKPEIVELEPEPEIVLVSVPELSKWERDDDILIFEEKVKEEEKTAPKVTTEIIKRAENVLFQKGAKSRTESGKAPSVEPVPKETEKVALATETVVREAKKAGNSIQITIPTLKSSEEPPKSSTEKLKDDKPARIPVKERLGAKVEVERHTLKSTVEPKIKSQAIVAGAEPRQKSEVHKNEKRSEKDRKYEHKHRKEYEDRKHAKEDRHRSKHGSYSSKRKSSKDDTKSKRKVELKEEPKSKHSTSQKLEKHDKDKDKEKDVSIKKLDEANFEPDYDLTSDSGTEHLKEQKKVIAENTKKVKKVREKQSVETTETSSDVESTATESSTDSSRERRKRKKKEKKKKKKKRSKKHKMSTNSDTEPTSETESESEETKHKHKRKHKHKKKKKNSKKKKSKNK